MEAEGDEGGQGSEAEEVGEHAGRRRLETQVVDRRQPDGRQVHPSGGEPVGERERDAGDQSDDRRHPNAAGRHQPGDERLVGAAGAAIEVAVEVVVRPTDEELPREHRRHRPGGAPSATGREGEDAHRGRDREDRLRVGAANQVPGRLDEQITNRSSRADVQGFD